MRRPRIKLDNLVAVLTVAERHDIDAAANEMGLSSSAVRKQIDVIEGVLGVRLFIRRKGSLTLTEDGKLFIVDARKSLEYALLAEEKTMAREALKNRHLIIGHSTYLPPKLIAFINQLSMDGMPPVQIQHVSGLTSTIVQRVMEGSLHAGFGFLPVNSPELLVRPIHEEPLVACIPSEHRLATRALIYPQDLDGEQIIAVSREPLPQFHQEIDEHFAQFGVQLKVAADAFSPPEALTYVVHKVGICLLANTSITLRPGITVRPLSTHVLMRRSGIFIREDNRSPLLQKLVNLVIRQVKDARLK